jgi:branched-subunit amino acid ABC-type transport system permease component
MSQSMIIATTLVALVGVTLVLMGSLVWHIRSVRRSGPIPGLWRTFGLSLAFCGLFFISWLAQGVAEWGSYRAEQQAHSAQATLSGYIVEFGQSTLENWQSEFLQLFSFVVFSALLIHRDSAESKDSDERMEEKIDKIAKRLDELDPIDATH